MSKPIIKIAVPPRSYAALETLGQAVFLSMTGNLNFPTPSPTLVSIQTATTALSNAITAWGTPGHRGSHLDLVNLRSAATNLRNLLLQEAAYVVNLVDPSADALTQKAFILSSGFQVKDDRSPQGVLAAPQNVHQLIQKNLSQYTPKLKWKKPLGVANSQNVKAYSVYRSATNAFSAAVQIATVTKTTFTDQAAPKGSTQYYFIAGINTAGFGVASDGLAVLIPN